MAKEPVTIKIHFHLSSMLLKNSNFSYLWKHGLKPWKCFSKFLFENPTYFVINYYSRKNELELLQKWIWQLRTRNLHFIRRQWTNMYWQSLKMISKKYFTCPFESNEAQTASYKWEWPCTIPPQNKWISCQLRECRFLMNSINDIFLYHHNTWNFSTI